MLIQFNRDFEDRLDTAKARARCISLNEQCVQHVNISSKPVAEGLSIQVSISDWYSDGSTVFSYSNGKELL